MSLRIILIFVLGLCFCRAEAKHFQNYPLVVIVSEDKVDVLVSRDDLPEDAIKSMLPNQPEHNTWVFFGEYKKTVTGRIVRGKYRVSPIRGGEFSFFIDLPGRDYVRYDIDVIGFKKYLNNEARWTWRPRIGQYKER